MIAKQCPTCGVRLNRARSGSGYYICPGCNGKIQHESRSGGLEDVPCRTPAAKQTYPQATRLNGRGVGVYEIAGYPDQRWKLTYGIPHDDTITARLGSGHCYRKFARDTETEVLESLKGEEK